MEEREKTFLAKWLAGELSTGQVEKISREEDLSLLRKIADTAADLELEEFDQQKAWESLLKRRRTRQHQLRRMSKFAIAAGLVALLALSWWLWVSPRPVELTSGAAQKPTHTLPDGSAVQLNAVSQLKIIPRHGIRAVEMKGESFFSVKPGGSFVVKTPLGEVTVLGTSFNVLARPPDLFSVSCYSGRVRVQTRQAVVELTPGRQAQLDEEGNLEVSNFELTDERKASWTTGVSKFKAQALPLVFAEMERQFDVRILHQALEARLYTGIFPHDDLNKALQLVCGPMRLHYSRNDRGEIMITE